MALGLAALLVVCAGAWALVASGGGGDRRYETGAFSFTYPSGWQEIDGIDFPLADSFGAEGVGRDTVGIDPDNWVTVFSTTVGIEIDERNVGALLPAARATFAELVRSLDGGRLLQEPYVVSEVGMPGFRVRVALKSTRGVLVDYEVTQLYRGRDTYIVGCQNRPARATEITAGCAQVLETFRPRPESASVGGPR